MTATREIKITIDEDAIREQVSTAITDTLTEAAGKLRAAANALDGGAWSRDQDEWMNDQIRKAEAHTKELIRFIREHRVAEGYGPLNVHEAKEMTALIADIEATGGLT